MPTDHKVRRDPGRRKRRTALQARIEYESAHPEVAITSPLTSRSRQWEVSTADGTSRFGEVGAMLDFLAARFGPLECERRGV
ncbi:MAG TPA: hypothetical protein VGD91_12140 [Trebonia sp.]